jgi:hypothetical protein
LDTTTLFHNLEESLFIILYIHYLSRISELNFFFVKVKNLNLINYLTICCQNCSGTTVEDWHLHVVIGIYSNSIGALDWFECCLGELGWMGFYPFVHILKCCMPTMPMTCKLHGTLNKSLEFLSQCFI